MSPTSLTPYAPQPLLTLHDVIERQSILHPIAIGSVAIMFLFACLRLSSNRTMAPLTIWDGICTVALGSTLASIVNGQQLVRGVLALSTLLLFQYITSWIGSKLPKLGILFTKPPLIVAFRGRLLEGLMRKHRITKVDIYGALRKNGILNICEVECAIVEPTGDFSIFKKTDMPSDYEPEILLAIKGYRDMVKADEEEKLKQKEQGMSMARGGSSQSTLTAGSSSKSVEQGKQGRGVGAEDEEGMTKHDRIAHEAA